MPNAPIRQYSFAALRHEIWFRIISPFDSVPFWTYSLLTIAAAGSGVLIESLVLLKSEQPNFVILVNSLCIFAPALASTSAFYLILTENEKRHLRGFAIIPIVILIVFAFVLNNIVSEGVWSLVFAVLLSILALLLWWIFNGAESTLHSGDPIDTLGGDPTGELPGSVKDYK